jgi:PAS domain S-box-containing protein
MTSISWREILIGWIAVVSMVAYLSEHMRAKEYAARILTQAGVARDHIKAMDLRYNNALMIQEIGQATATVHDDNQMIQAAAKAIKARSGYDRSLIMLADSAGQTLSYAAGFGYNDETKKQLMSTDFHLDRPNSKGIFVKAFKEKKPLLIQNMDEIVDDFSERSKKIAMSLAGKSMICVPIAYEDQVLGIIAIDNSNTERPLTQSDVSLLMGVASQLAVGIVNTRSYTQLQASEKKYRDLVENAHSIILRIDPAGRIVFFNKFAQKLFGYSESQVYGKSISEVLYPAISGSQYWIDTLAEAILPDSDIPRVEETAYALENGQTIWIAWTYRAIFSADGKLIEILCIGNDITQLKQTIEENAKLEIQLIRAQKMEALGTLAGGVAHDLNNVLAGVINYPELMLMRLPQDSPLRRYATSIQKSGERAAAIVQDLLTLARRNVVQIEAIRLNDVVSEYISSPEFDRLRLNHPLAKVSSLLDPHVNGILGSSVQLSKAVMNLVTNAVEALEGKPGDVTILTENCRLTDQIDAYERIPPGGYVRLTVVDTGCGMATDDLRRIFEPFFSRKKMGRSGTGLGMAVVWGTIKDHGGLFDIHSTPGRGTRFDIYFPPTLKEGKKVEAISVETYRGNGEKILIIDDEESQREIAHEILTDLGYKIKTVPSGEAAIEALKEEPADLVVLDMIMASGMDGLDTYRQIVLQCPSQRAIIASGFSENEKVQQAMQLGVGQYVKKPYNREGLGKAVRQELDRKVELMTQNP